MKFDDLENELRRVPRRQPPPEWRAQILSAEAPTSSPSDAHATVAAQRQNHHRPGSTGAWIWQWNWNWAWSALAAGWLGILGLHHLTPHTSDPTEEWAVRQTGQPANGIARSANRAPLDDLAWWEQRRLLAQLLQENGALPSVPPPQRRGPIRLGPRSDRPGAAWGQYEPLPFTLDTAQA